MIESKTILINNLKSYYNVRSIRLLARKMNYSHSILLNWSSNRSSPSISQLNEIAYNLGVEASQLLIENNVLTLSTPIWKDNVEKKLIENLDRLKLEKDINEKTFNENCGMSYRSFLRFTNGKSKIINLRNLDTLACILSVNTYELLEGRLKE